FHIETLQRAHEVCYKRALIDIISMIKHAANHQQPLLTATERVERVFQKLIAGQSFTAEQQKWLERIRVHMVENLSIDSDDFDLMPVFSREGGWIAARRAFDGRLDVLLHELNEAIAA